MRHCILTWVERKIQNNRRITGGLVMRLKENIKNEYDKINEREEHRYDALTINSPNLFARYAHRNRIKKGLRYVIPRLELGNILDYGCGSGVFVSEINKIKPGVIS
jgi:16S rRNA G1207 methylase RsmC